MNVKWLEKIQNPNVRIEEVYIDDVTYFMRLVHMKILDMDVYIFTPPCQLLGNVTQIKKYNDYDNFDFTANLTLENVRDAINKLGARIVREHSTYVEIVYPKSIKMIININAAPEEYTNVETNPVRVPTTPSYLEDLRLKRRIANYLKFFTLFCYSNTGQLSFDIVGSRHKYDVYTRNIKNDTFITPDFQVRVNNENLIPRLQQFLDVTLRNSSMIVENFKHKLNVDFFSNVDELSNHNNPKEILFSSLSNAVEYSEKHKRQNIVSSALLPHSIVAGPFYFSHENVCNGKLFISQPVLSIEHGVNTCIEWKDNKRNYGDVDHLSKLGGLVNVPYFVMNECDDVSGENSKTIFMFGEGDESEHGHCIVKNRAGKYFAMLKCDTQ